MSRMRSTIMTDHDIIRFKPVLSVGQKVVVNWSNGAGFSIYETRDTAGPITFALIAEYEVGSDGKYEKVVR